MELGMDLINTRDRAPAVTVIKFDKTVSALFLK